VSDFGFGVETGRLTAKERRRRHAIAERHGCDFICVTGNDAGHCVCGHGCKVGACPVKRYWGEQQAATGVAGLCIPPDFPTVGIVSRATVLYNHDHNARTQQTATRNQSNLTHGVICLTC